MNERRRIPRRQVVDEVIGRVKATIPARIVDISPFGAQVEVSAALRPTVECDVWVPVDDGQLKVRAAVRRCRATGVRGDGREGAAMVYRAGLEFVGLSESDADVLTRAYPLPCETDALEQPAATPRRGPLKIRLNVDSVRRRLDEVET